MSKFTNFALAAALAFTGLTGAAQAEYPEKPVEFVVPWPPGDLEDVLTRMIAEDFSEAYGVPTAVVNKPGGGAARSLGPLRSRLRPQMAIRLDRSLLRSPLLALKSVSQS